MNAKIVMLIVSSAVAFAGTAAQYYAKDGISDWTTKDSFTLDAEGTLPSDKVPGAEAEGVDEVFVKNKTTVTVGDKASLDAINRLARIRPIDQQAQLVFIVPEGETWTNRCPVNYDGATRTSYMHYGNLIKRGAGTLELYAPAKYMNGTAYLCDYCTMLVAEEGGLILPQTDGTGDYSGKTFYCYGFAVSNNATMHPCAGMTTQGTALFGEERATITNQNDAAAKLTLSGRTAGGKAVTQVYAGIIGGNIEFGVGARLWLTGTNSTLSGSMRAFNNGETGSAGNGIIGVRKFGMKADPTSSFGLKGYIMSGHYLNSGYSGGGIRCLREADDPEETTDKNLTFYSNLDGANLVDAGDNGGVTFIGDWIRSDPAQAYWPTRQMGSIHLWGENENPCVIKGAVKITTYDNVRYPFHFVKEGGGVWRLADQTGVTMVNKDRDGVGAVTIKDGTLQVESIGRKYDRCALGTGRETTEAYQGEWDESKRVDWQFALGGETTEGTLEYVGTEAVNAYSRPLVFRGDARLRNSSAAQVRYLALPAEGSAAKTVTLDGTNTLENELSDIIDTAAAPVSVVKEGAGKWVLGGNLQFHGPITVKDGELVIRTYPKKYSWYKWIVKQSYTNEQQKTGGDILGTRCFAIYDKDNIRQNGDLTVVTNGFASLQPGQATCETTHKIEDYAGARPWATIFQDYAGGFGMYLSRDCDAFDATIKATTGNPYSWIPFVMRLRDDANEVVAWDYALYFGRTKDNVPFRTIGTSTIEGSADGIHWDNVLGGDKVIDGEDIPAGSNCWMSPGSLGQVKGFANGDAANHTTGGTALAIPDGFKFAKTKPDGFTVLPDGVEVRACGGKLMTEGGVVTVKALTVDMNKTTVLDGLAFAEGGTLTIENYVSDGKAVKLPVTFANATDQAKLAGWTLAFAGTRQYHREIRVAADGSVTLEPFGLSVIIR